MKKMLLCLCLARVVIGEQAQEIGKDACQQFFENAGSKGRIELKDEARDDEFQYFVFEMVHGVDI